MASSSGPWKRSFSVRQPVSHIHQSPQGRPPQEQEHGVASGPRQQAASDLRFDLFISNEHITSFVLYHFTIFYHIVYLMEISWRAHGVCPTFGVRWLVSTRTKRLLFFIYCILALSSTLCRHSVNICWGINGHGGASGMLMSWLCWVRSLHSRCSVLIILPL